MLKVALRGLLSHKLRLVLTGIAIVLGVSFVTSTFVVTDTINGVFANIFTDASHGTDVVVRGDLLAGATSEGNASSNQSQRLPVTSSVVAMVRKVEGVDQAYGVVFRTGATVLDKDGKPIGGNGPPTFGANWIERAGSPFHIRKGRPPKADNEVVLDVTTAEKSGIDVGQNVDIVLPTGASQTFKVSGITSYGNANNIAGATITLFTTQEAISALDTHGEFDEVDIVAQSGVSDETLKARVAVALPPHVNAATGVEAANEQIKNAQNIISTFIGTPLLVFGIISLFVGSFLIANTFTILITQRSRELALLRALGATARQVLTSVLVEAFLIGIVASIAGALVGILLAVGLKALLNAFGFALPNSGLTLAPRTFVIAIGLGTLVTLLASIFPARRATRLAPVAALRDAEPETQPITRRRIVGGAIASVLGVVALALGLFAGTSQTLPLVGLGSLIFFIGIAYLAPLLVLPIAAIIGAPIAKLRGVPGKLARENATRNPRRTSSTGAALMVGVALVGAVSILASSLKESTTVAVEGSITSQLLVSNKSHESFGTAVSTQLSQDKRFRDVTEIRTGDLVIRGAQQSLSGIDPTAINNTIKIDVVSGNPTSISDSHNVAVDNTDAQSHKWSIGDTITAQFPYAAKPVALRIGAIYRSNALVSGYLVSLATYKANFPNQQDVVVLVNPAPNISADQGLNTLNSVLAAYPTLSGETRQQFIADTGKQIDQLSALIDILLLMSLVIALLGIVNTLALSVVERTRELGLLRALGLTRRQMRSMVRWESVIIAFLGAFLGILVGTGLGIAVVHALADHGLGHLSVPVGMLFIYTAIAAVFGILAAIFPARRAARLNILEAISTE